MKLVLICGNSAVGKMSVGQALAHITQLRLFHNHMTIEPVIEVFGTYRSDVVVRLREVFFSEFLKTDLYGMIFTYMWAFDMKEDWDYITTLKKRFEAVGGEVYCVELVTDQETRLKRNATPNRLKHKPSKRNIPASNERLILGDTKYRLESLPGEIPFPNYLKIDNTHLTPEEVAEQIKIAFQLA